MTLIPKYALVATCGGTLSSIVYSLMLRSVPVAMTWFSLLLGPCITIGAGLAVISASPGLPLYGVFLVGIGVLNLLCAYCWRRYVPLTAAVLKVVATVFGRNLRMIAVGLFTIVLSLIWYVMVGCTFSNLFANQRRDTTLEQFVFLVACFWGLVVFANV